MSHRPATILLSPSRTMMRLNDCSATSKPTIRRKTASEQFHVSDAIDQATCIARQLLGEIGQHFGRDLCAQGRKRSGGSLARRQHRLCDRGHELCAQGQYGRARERTDRRRWRAERSHRIVDLHACAWGQLAALGHSADLMFINSIASRRRIRHPNTLLNENVVASQQISPAMTEPADRSLSDANAR
jgi:hypothetical protein